MNALIAAALQLFVGFGVGAWLVPRRPARWPVAGWAALTALAGLCGLAALLNSAGTFGVPAALVQWVAYPWALAGALRAWRRRGPSEVPRAREGAAVALVALLTLAPWVASLGGPSMAHDTAAIWYPKILDASDRIAPSRATVAFAHPAQAHAIYPRGLAWIAVLGDPLGRLDTALPRATSLVFTTLGALAAAGWFLARGKLGWGLLAAALCLSIPEISSSLASGMADIPLAMALLLVSIGLAWSAGSDPALETGAARSHGPLLAAIGAAAAASIKAEGSIVYGVVALWAFVGILRGPRERRRGFALAWIALAIVIPWWRVRATLGPDVLERAGLLWDPLFAGGRLSLLAEKLFLQATDPARFDPSARDPEIAWAAWTLASGLLLLWLCRVRPVPSWHLLAMLAADLLVYVATIHDLTWHLQTSAARLWTQLCPALLLSLFTAAAAPPPSAVAPQLSVPIPTS